MSFAPRTRKIEEVFVRMFPNPHALISARICDNKVRAPAHPSLPVIFRALTFNMQNGEPWSPCEDDTRPANLAGTAAFLSSTAADIFFLQEVEAGHDGGGQPDPPPNFTALRGALPDYDAVFAYPPDNPDELPFGLGLAIFSRFPLSGFFRVDLPAADLVFEFGGRHRRPSARLLIGVEASTPAGPLVLLNTHLQAYFMIGSTAEEHPRQREIVCEHARAAGPRVLLGGDFNCAPDEALVAALVAAGLTPAQTSTPTWKRRPYVVDHLFHGGGLLLKEWAVLATDTSDHDALLGIYETSA